MGSFHGEWNKLQTACVAFGAFDALHIGERDLIRRAHAQVAPGMSLAVVGCAADVPALYTAAERAALIRTIAPADAIVPSADGADGSPHDFVREVLIGRMGASIIVTSEDIRFGKGKEGDAALLSETAAANGCACLVLPAARDAEGRTVSGEAIRALLARRDLGKANALLGVPFTIFGKIVGGKGLGRTVQMPTANLDPEPGKLLPPNGVYATRIVVGGAPYRAITNIGQRPSVDTHDYLTIETHILDFNRTIYGETVELSLLEYIRAIRKFDSIAEVKAQVEQDLARVKDCIF